MPRSLPLSSARSPAGTARSPADTAVSNGPHDAQREDIRLLGRILGDTIREHEGRDTYELIEKVRQLAVAFRLKKDAQAGRTLDRLLKNLSGDQTVSVIRAFSYFAHLANIAEDHHHVRLRAFQDRKGQVQEGSL